MWFFRKFRESSVLKIESKSANGLCLLDRAPKISEGTLHTLCFLSIPGLPFWDSPRLSYANSETNLILILVL
jgi:hypothetical protein